VLAVARLAGIQGAKHTALLVPLCHNIFISGVKVDVGLDKREFAVDIRAQASTAGPTGVEMEALTAVSVAALTVYDMCKAVCKGIRITQVCGSFDVPFDYGDGWRICTEAATCHRWDLR
jgi:cyclic pyranopterin phosphate synthase